MHADLAHHVALCCVALLAVTLIRHDLDRYSCVLASEAANEPATPRGPPHYYHQRIHQLVEHRAERATVTA